MDEGIRDVLEKELIADMKVGDTTVLANLLAQMSDTFIYWALSNEAASRYGKPVAKENFKLVRDEESLNIYIDNGDDRDPTHVVYWHMDEWLEDSESVTGAMLNAMELFYTNPQKLLDTLKLPYYLVD